MEVMTEKRELDVCTECEPNARLESNSSLLRRAECPIHGVCWHLPMVVDPDGRRVLRFPLANLASKKNGA
jgi:hypothetical protein